MLNKLTVEDKINKILEYCEYTNQLATDAGHWVDYLVEIENTYAETETEDQHAVRIYRRRIGYTINNSTLLYYICQAVLDAQQHSQNYNCLSSVNVCIRTYNSECELIDEEPIDEYEINFENGIEVQ